MLQVHRHKFFDYFDYVKIFVGIFPLNAMNLNVLSLFAGSSFLVCRDFEFVFPSMYFINNKKLVKNILYQFE